jgi:hypothetical protein
MPEPPASPPAPLSPASTNYRDEQFWFTAAVVGFNVVSLGNLCGWFSVVVSAVVSLLGIHIVLTRWVAGAGRQPPNPPDAKIAPARERLRYSIQESKAAWGSLAYVAAEFSGSLFFLAVIILTFIGVLLKFLN